MSIKVQPIVDLEELKATGNTGFFVGLSLMSYVVSYQGNVYLFPREPDEMDMDFTNTLFGFFCDPVFLQENPQAAKDKANLIVMQDLFWPVLITVEQMVLPLLYVPNEDIGDIIASRVISGTAEDPTVTFH